MQEALNQKIDAFVAANKEQILKDIATLVSINSVEGTPEEGAPYGAGPRAALDKTLELAAGMGLATRNCENHIGYAELAGADAEKYLATICHVDVVPEGNGWTEDPFKMEIRDGWMIGRGVADDKGPMVATLYALKFLKEEGVSLRYPIRALVGDNEETSMADVKYYLKHYPAPVFCFTPDAEFPVCNGEPCGHRIQQQGPADLLQLPSWCGVEGARILCSFPGCGEIQRHAQHQEHVLPSRGQHDHLTVLLRQPLDPIVPGCQVPAPEQ